MFIEGDNCAYNVCGYYAHLCLISMHVISFVDI